MGQVDTTFRALAEERRRLALAGLQEHDTLALADLAEYVAEAETGRDATALSGETVRDVYFSLYHNHVPTLEEADLARYEQEQDLITRTERTKPALNAAFEELDALVQSDSPNLP